MGVFGWKRPLGVYMMTAGGLCGYSDGNLSTPWYRPPKKGESGGPSSTKWKFRMLPSCGLACASAARNSTSTSSPSGAAASGAGPASRTISPLGGWAV